MFGTEGGARLPREATAWGADGAFEVAPMIWAHLYTAHAVTQGCVIPCAYALLPDNPGATYQRVRRQVREAAGEVASGNQRLVAIGSERASIDAVHESSPAARIAGCYFRLGQPV